MQERAPSLQRDEDCLVKRWSDGYWEWFEASEPRRYVITGKYLFFSADRDLLVSVATQEIQTGGFHLAKTHMTGVAPPSGEYVLCLYFRDDSRKRELAAKYRDRPHLKYRYWKSDEDTRRGKYSAEFLQKLSPEDRQCFEGSGGDRERSI